MDMDRLKLPPQNLEAESSVLGAILIDNNALNKVVEGLSWSDFYSHANRLIYQGMIDLYQGSQPIDLITLIDSLKKKSQLEEVGGASYLAALADNIPTAANVEYYSNIVREKAVLRQLIEGSTNIIDSSYKDSGNVDELLDQAEKIVFDIAQRKIKRSFSSIQEIVKHSFKVIEELYEKKELITGVPTGFTEFDKLTAGLQPSDLIIIAGRPSMGKTALALNMAGHAAMEGQVSTAIFSLEMSKEQLVQRMLCCEARVDASKLRGGYLSESDWPRLTRAAGALSESSIFIDDSPAMNVLEMRAKARRLQREHGLGLVIVDYLQLMRGIGRSGAESREREISEISRSLKALAKELAIPVVALSQLNRGVESRQDKRPQLADLRESGSIEQDADVVAFIYREEVYNKDTPDKGVAELIIGKQRNGPIGRIKLAFLGQYTRFENLARGMDDYAPPSGPSSDDANTGAQNIPTPSDTPF
ncbi:replicative DNA helicase [bacterium]|nr:replicative DNA helicase [bacterium]